MNKVEFRQKWVGRKFKCLNSGEEFTIPDNVRKGDFFYVGDGFIDVGDEFMHRVGGNLIEVRIGDENE